MEKELESYACCMAHDNGIDVDFCRSLIRWMDNEGTIDYAVIRETYSEPTEGVRDTDETVPVRMHLV